jgi:hypothetical protein
VDRLTKLLFCLAFGLVIAGVAIKLAASQNAGEWVIIAGEAVGFVIIIHMRRSGRRSR